MDFCQHVADYYAAYAEVAWAFDVDCYLEEISIIYSRKAQGTLYQ